MNDSEKASSDKVTGPSMELVEAESNNLYFSMPLENGQLEISIPRSPSSELSLEDAKDTVTMLQTVMKRMKREIARHGAEDADTTA